MPDTQTAPADELDIDAKIEAAYRAGFEDGWHAAKDGGPLAVAKGSVRRGTNGGSLLSFGSGLAVDPTFSADPKGVYSDQEIQTVLQHFRTNRQQLERDHFNRYVTIDIATGRMAVAPSGIAAVEAYEKEFGPSKTITMHIGTTK